MDLRTARQVTRTRAGEVCEGCGQQRGSQAHHRLPRGMGGTHRAAAARVNAASNLLWLCTDCHTWVEAHRTAGRQRGWLLHHGQDPCQVGAVLITALGAQTWWLDDIGGYLSTPPGR